ncbi:hypothetical protein INT48_001383 [Thamnidium elegans]|uniref:Uncharacterized protein n=1 Tax=Thamnidium elegans TaxID=101142 RepID=A0A8H7W2N8_9FUNG|nr:hypothetical protein INT48_001383 [Thamnidium elegans]
MEELDLRLIRFVDTTNDNLICCICQAPYIEPVITHCGHTFCTFCIYQAIEASPVCPIDRANISIDDIQPAAKIISNMVNELSVYCPRHEQGCAHICQRQYIESHLKYHCQYTMAPCKLDECKELLLKKDLGTHVKTCKYRIVECNMCKKKMCSYELEDHYSLCPSEIIECQYCKTSRSRSDHNSHIAQCPQFNISCPQAEFGCSWNDQRQLLSEHTLTCPYEAITNYLQKQQKTETLVQKELRQLHKENATLKREQEESKKHVNTIVNQLDLMFPGHFLLDADIPVEARNESILSESQRLNSELETLSANIASLELKQNMALMTETFRLQEELQSLRAICHGLRMQMHYVMMDRRNNTSSTSSNNTATVSATNQNRNNENTNAANRARNYLGKDLKKITFF